MQQVSDKMELAALERRLTTQIFSLKNDLVPRIETLENPVFEANTAQAPPNYLPNSAPEWSKAAYTTAGVTSATAGDTNHEAYNWYAGTAATTDLSSLAALVDSGHSTYAGLNADDAVWDRANATFLLGGSTALYDVACPLPTDFVFPGQKFYLYFEAAKAQSDTDENSTQFYCGFWDNTAGQRKWIEGSSFTPTASVWGVAGARTLKYKVLLETDTGSQILSSEITVATAPASLSADNHVRLSFSGAPGFIRYVIYRKDGTNVYRVGEIRNSIDLQFYDLQETGSSVVLESGYPSVSGSKPQAYAITNTFSPGSVGTVTAHTMTIQIPTTYDKSVTGNLQQWFRFGLSNLVAAGSEREIVIRNISLSQGYGGWTRSILDMSAKSGPSTSAASAPTGGTTTTEPPSGGGGGQVCLPLDMIVPTLNGDRSVGELSLSDHCVIGPMALPIKRIRDGEVQFLWEFELETGEVIRCSDSHRLITSLTDRKGRPAFALQEGDSLLTQRFTESRIIRKEQILGQAKVRQIFLPEPHIFIANGVVNHNVKPIDAVIV